MTADTRAAALRSCPFCGGVAALDPDSGVYCTRCPAQLVGTMQGESRGRWNLRAALAEPELDREALRLARAALGQMAHMTTKDEVWAYVCSDDFASTVAALARGAAEPKGTEEPTNAWLSGKIDSLRARDYKRGNAPSAPPPTVPSEAIYDDAMSRRVWLDHGDPPSAPSPAALAERLPFICDERGGVVAVYRGPERNCLAGPEDSFVFVRHGEWDEAEKHWTLAGSYVLEAQYIADTLNLGEQFAARALREPSDEDVARELAKSLRAEGMSADVSESYALDLVRAVNAARERARGIE